MPVFILMIAAVACAMYTGTVNSFLDAQGEHMKYLLANDIYGADWLEGEDIAWYFDQWEKRPEKMREEWTEEMSDRIINNYPDYYEKYDVLSDCDSLEAMPDELKTYKALILYNIAIRENSRTNLSDNNSHYCVKLP